MENKMIVKQMSVKDEFKPISFMVTFETIEEVATFLESYNRDYVNNDDNDDGSYCLIGERCIGIMKDKLKIEIKQYENTVQTV